jgi:hypothetical protein
MARARSLALATSFAVTVAGCGQSGKSTDMAMHHSPGADMSTTMMTPAADMAMPGGTPTDLSAASPPDLTGMIVHAMTEVNADGGIVSAGNGLSLAVPAGAIAGGTEITVLETTTPPPDMGVISPVYAFGPDGTVFAHPVTVSFPLPSGAPANTRLFWSRHGAPGFDNIGGTIVGGFLQASVTHFSEGFLAPGDTSRTISGTRQTTWFTPTGNIQNVPFDLSTGIVEALVPQMGGGYMSIAGSGNSDGTFTIPSVPDGLVWVHTKPVNDNHVFTLTAGSSSDTTHVQLGRMDVQPVTMGATILVSADNMDAWADGDSLELNCANADTAWQGEQAYSSPPVGMPASGDTSLSGFSFDANFGFSDYGGVMLIDGSKGDVGVLEHLASHSLGGNSGYVGVTSTATLPPFTMIDGSSVSVSGHFAPVAQASTTQFTIKGSEFLQYLTAANPNAYAPTASSGPVFADITAQPGGLNFSGRTWNADIMLLWTDGDLTTPTINYGVPDDGGTWAPFMIAGLTTIVDYTASGATNKTSLYGRVVRSDTIDRLTATAIEPTVTPATMAKIAGNDLFTAGSFVCALRTTLTWSPPAVGTPEWYNVVIYQLGKDGNGNTTYTTPATFTTTQTSLEIPSGILSLNQQYVFGITAGIGGNPRAAVDTLPSAWADLFSAIQLCAAAD